VTRQTKSWKQITYLQNQHVSNKYEYTCGLVVSIISSYMRGYGFDLLLKEQ
jgi:hypothetical protein